MSLAECAIKIGLIYRKMLSVMLIANSSAVRRTPYPLLSTVNELGFEWSFWSGSSGSGFREIPEISEPEPKFKFRVRHRPNFAEPVRTRSNSEPVPRLGGDPSPSFVWSAGKWLRIKLSRFFASVMDTLGNLENSDGSLRPASEIVFYNNIDDDHPISGPRSDLADPSTLHPFFTNATKPVGKVAGSHRSGHRPHPSTCLAETLTIIPQVKDISQILKMSIRNTPNQHYNTTFKRARFGVPVKY
ncbi:hypothetical protein C8R44DRAFT_751473 [Mycena epipterygia]|nr:hypothetical protein C8R44DRAFT_751473 [Mycena epipterygia]